jgi:clan AA aspartic protease
MGLVYAEIELISSDDLAYVRKGYISETEIKRKKVKALVDSGAYMLAINEHIKAQLDLAVLDTQEAELANGKREVYEVVGPIEVHFENRSTSTRAIVLPGNAEVLLGSIPMEDMDVVIAPKTQQLIVNPENPYMAKKSLK